MPTLSWNTSGWPGNRRAPLSAQAYKIHVQHTLYKQGFWYFTEKSATFRGIWGQIRGKISRFRGIFAGKKSKFAQKSADIAGFLWEKSQNSQKNRPISRRLRVVTHFSASPFLAWGDFQARSRFARSTILEEKWGTTRSLDFAGF